MKEKTQRQNSRAIGGSVQRFVRPSLRIIFAVNLINLLLQLFAISAYRQIRTRTTMLEEQIKFVANNQLPMQWQQPTQPQMSTNADNAVWTIDQPMTAPLPAWLPVVGW